MNHCVMLHTHRLNVTNSDLSLIVSISNLPTVLLGKRNYVLMQIQKVRAPEFLLSVHYLVCYYVSRWLCNYSQVQISKHFGRLLFVCL